MKSQSYAITPEILSIQSKLRKSKFQGYLNELISINEEKFMSSADVQRGLDSISQGFQNEVAEEDLTFWVDPLDGSSGLA